MLPAAGDVVVDLCYLYSWLDSELRLYSEPARYFHWGQSLHTQAAEFDSAEWSLHFVSD